MLVEENIFCIHLKASESCRLLHKTQKSTICAASLCSDALGELIGSVAPSVTQAHSSHCSVPRPRSSTANKVNNTCFYYGVLIR